MRLRSRFAPGSNSPSSNIRPIRSFRWVGVAGGSLLALGLHLIANPGARLTLFGDRTPDRFQKCLFVHEGIVFGCVHIRIRSALSDTLFLFLQRENGLMPDATDLTDTIAATAAQPAMVETDGLKVQAVSIDELIAADKYLKAQVSGTNKQRGLRFTKLVPPGSV